MQVWLSVAKKDKLVRQVLVQKEEVLFMSCMTWENGGLPSERLSLFPAKTWVLIEIGRGGLF